MKKLFSVSLFVFGVSAFAASSNFVTTELTDLNNMQSTLQTADQQQKASMVKTVYTCPMHPEVSQDKAGKCPKCGMNLTAKEVAKDVYTCPMHPEVTSEKAGKCPKCGMNLAKKEPARKPEPAKK